MRLIFLLFITLAVSQVYSQVTFTITDASTGNTVAHAIIHLPGTGQSYQYLYPSRVTFPVPLPARVKIMNPLYREKEINLTTSDTLVQLNLELLSYQIDEVVITAFHMNRPLLQSAASIAVLDSLQLHRFEPVSLLPAMNLVPGVRMEQRSPGSYRLSIRGSLLRSPFGVRDVKIYFNGIPFTEAGGNTPLNLLDISLIEEVEVIKGPAGSVYGAGTGGVVNIRGGHQFKGNSASFSSAAGSFGFLKAGLKVQTARADHGFNAIISRQKSDGYRDHSAMERDNTLISGQVRLNDRQQLHMQLLYSKLFYQIPGGITYEQFLENPAQSREGSVQQNSSIHLNLLQPAVSHHITISPKLRNISSVYLNSGFFDHPFITDYKRDIQQGGGGLSRFVFSDTVAGIHYRLQAGGEYQQSLVIARNFGNAGGVPDTLRFDDELRTIQQHLFTQAEMDFPARFFLTLGSSFNFLSYDIFRLRDEFLDTSYRQKRNFQPVLAPRISLAKAFGDNHALHASISHGFSPPTVPEVRTNEGSVNTGLEAERGMNYEAGYRGRFLRNRIRFELTAFSLQLRQTIVSQPNPDGVVLFQNAGATTQNGIEASAIAYLKHDAPGFFSSLRYQASCTYNHFTFTEYVKNDVNFGGNFLPGVPYSVLVQAIDVKLRPGFYAGFSWNYTSEIPLNDANTVVAAEYHLLKVKSGLQAKIFKRHTMEIFAGIDNVLDETYSLGNDLNAFGRRFYQAAPPRNYFTGLRIALESF